MLKHQKVIFSHQTWIITIALFFSSVHYGCQFAKIHKLKNLNFTPTLLINLIEIKWSYIISKI